ncbi:MAG: cation-translocating P-type ATPase [Clostridia bacterium]|nr:cation-translocating P-type ATPase [Clostridia bacterium]
MEDNLIEKDGPETCENERLTGQSLQSIGGSKFFDIGPVDLTRIVDKYKERGETFNDIQYFKEEGGIDKLLGILKTDKQNGVSSTANREIHFGSNKIFKKPPPSFCDFIKEALSDKMIIILICCSIFEIGISVFNIIKGEKNMDYIDGLSIIFAVLVVVSVGSITNYKKEQKFHELNDVQNGQTKYNIIRNGIPSSIVADDLLVGDLIKINYGEILPADILMVEGNGIKIDESSLTGESDAMTKKPFEKCLEEFEQGNSKPSSNILLSGTNVIEGAGAGIVIAIGEHSQKGIIRGTIDNAQENNKTPLEMKLDAIANLIGYFGLGSAVITLIALVIQMIVRYVKDEVTFTFGDMIGRILDIIILCVSIIVVAIPEGLPLAVTLSLAFSIKRLMDNNNLVRKMHACETMGGANYICTDKTGTLTQNLMFVVRLVTHNEAIEIKQNAKINDINLKSKSGQKLRQDRTDIIQNNNYWDVLRTTVSLNVDATITKLNSPNQDGDTEVCDSKNKTDKGFIEFLYQFRSPISEEKEIYMNSPENYKLFPFDSKKKRMSTFVKNENFPTGYRLFTKGGSENAMTYSNRYIDHNTGAVKEITDEIISFVNHEINEMNKKMMRTLYICYRDITEEEYERCNEPDSNGLLIDQKDLIFIGIFGLRDSLRPGVDMAVKKCHNAGVSVIMVTGDNLVTATAIAKECNIFPEKIDLDNPRLKDIERNPNDINDPNKRLDHITELLNVKPYAMTGNSFYSVIGGIICQICGKDTISCRCPKSEAEAEELKKTSGVKKPVKIDVIANMDNFRKISTNMLVMARSQPIHKYALVLGLKTLGHVVAVTGDGTNDAPALSKSDVGFSMADGTDIAKEASDIIIMDNNFTSIVVAMIYGRSIYENIRKFLQFQLTVNFCACILVFICSCVGNETPLNSIQMLWVNLIMDSLGSLALATEPPYDELLNRKPTNRKESIINGRMWKHIILQSICEIALLLTLYLAAPLFIKEYKDDIKNSAKDLYDCFGQLPGDQNVNDFYILFGNKDKWGSTTIRQDKLNATECSKYLPNEGDPDRSKTSLGEAFSFYQMEYGGTTHMTLIFDTFVLYTLFNQVNCRIIDDSVNTFKRINKGCMFILVTLVELVVQIIISQIGYTIFHCVLWGLSIEQWLICLGFSVSTMVFNLIFKFIPLEKLIDPCTKPAKEVYSDDTKASTTIKEMVNQLLPDA